MGTKKLKVFEDLPLEVEKSYVTKMQSKETFTVKKISVNKFGKQVGVWGIFDAKPELGMCPLDPGRLIHEKKELESNEVCDCCEFPINEKHVGKRSVLDKIS